ncbi:hypothetical protein MIR68_012324 [Amoeboaphelidium protococcarum]|nr:hypothetical protein MIR68_012324 [Amoeboaphelidium protococcarum]
MTSVLSQFDAGHEDMIHDAQFDYYGKRVATCSSDKSIHVYKINSTDNQVDAGSKQILKGHDGPVWSVQWAHPQHGSVLVSGGYDGKVIVWKETPSAQSVGAQKTISTGGGRWEQFFVYKQSSSVNAIAINQQNSEALEFASVSSDGKLVIHLWDAQIGNFRIITEVEAHYGGCFTAAYNCNQAHGVLMQVQQESAAPHPFRLVTGGADNLVKVWKQNATTKKYELEHTLEGHQDWVRDVAWAPFNPTDLIASGSTDKTVLIWKYDDATQTWKRSNLTSKPFADTVWKVSFSSSGGYVLGVSVGESKVFLYRLNFDEKSGEPVWENIGEVDESGAQSRSNSVTATSPQQQQQPLTSGR